MAGKSEKPADFFFTQHDAWKKLFRQERKRKKAEREKTKEQREIHWKEPVPELFEENPRREYSGLSH